MNYLNYVPTPEELADVEARHRQAEIDLPEQTLHDLLVLGRDVIKVHRQKAAIQSLTLCKDHREIDLRRQPDLTVGFDRLARAIRMIIQLHQKILDLYQPPPARPEPAPATDEPLDDVARPPADKIITKACQDLTAAVLGPNATIPDTGPQATIETLRAHLSQV